MTLTQNVPRNVVFEVSTCTSVCFGVELSLGEICYTPAKRSQHVNATLLGAIRCVRLSARPVATCWVSLAKFEDVKEKEKVKIQWKVKER